MLGDAESLIETLEALKALGVRLVLDDFGTGYSSLGYLTRLPLDALKVDRSFVDGLGTEPRDTAITEAIIAMAHALSLQVVGEGVETELQVASWPGSAATWPRASTSRGRCPRRRSRACSQRGPAWLARGHAEPLRDTPTRPATSGETVPGRTRSRPRGSTSPARRVSLGRDHLQRRGAVAQPALERRSRG